MKLNLLENTNASCELHFLLHVSERSQTSTAGFEMLKFDVMLQ